LRAVHFDYGQPSAEGERRAVLEIAKHYAVPIDQIKFGLPITNVRGEYLCRNAMFLLGAASILNSASARLALGIHTGTPFYDCSVPFLDDVQRLFDGYFGGTVQVEAPFAEFTKRDVFDFCVRNHVPIDLTFSCERQSAYPCGECRSCKERAMLSEGHEGF
jgi:7-cyano-7-deazaguanine synthase